jgi:starch synthase
MRVVFAASECVPWVKTGGLADVIGALPAEVARRGHEVCVYLPFYRQVQAKVKQKNVVIRSLTIPFEYYNRFVTILDGGIHEGVQVYFVESPELFDREYIYATPTGDYADNWERFGLFCRAVLESSKQLGVPDIFHVHEWVTAILPVYLRTTYYFDPVLRNAGAVLTVHNPGMQGWFPSVTTQRLLLPWDVYTMDRLEQYGSFNFLKGGLVYSDAITTVSRKYAEEIQTPEFGFGLDPTFRRRAADLHGILNGVDYHRWNPASDGNIAAHYTPENLEGKQACRRDLLYAFGLEEAGHDTPILGVLAHFSTHKGFDLIEQMIESLLQEDVRVVMLGTGEPYYENLFKTLHERYPGKLGVRVEDDEILTHKVEAGADILLMPSHYEPGGLPQIYGLKYGTVPVVRATGGLDDTIEEWDPATGEGTGFKFASLRAEDFRGKIDEATSLFRTDKARWQKLMHNGMRKDFSWDKPGEQFIALYEEVARRRS